MGQGTWEAVARDILESTGCDDPPVDAFELAHLCGLEVRAKSGPAHLIGDVIRVDMRTRLVRRHGQVAHELAHWALRRAHEDDHEDAAIYTAGCLLLPRRRFLRDLRETGDLYALMTRHPYVSAEHIARRICAVRGTVGSVWDHGAAPVLLGARENDKPATWERELVDAARANGGENRSAQGVAWLLPEKPWRRVVVLRAG